MKFLLSATLTKLRLCEEVSLLIISDAALSFHSFIIIIGYEPHLCAEANPEQEEKKVNRTQEAPLQVG